MAKPKTSVAKAVDSVGGRAACHSKCAYWQSDMPEFCVSPTARK